MVWFGRILYTAYHHHPHHHLWEFWARQVVCNRIPHPNCFLISKTVKFSTKALRQPKVRSSRCNERSTKNIRYYFSCAFFIKQTHRKGSKTSHQQNQAHFFSFKKENSPPSSSTFVSLFDRAGACSTFDNVDVKTRDCSGTHRIFSFFGYINLKIINRSLSFREWATLWEQASKS